MTRRWLRALSRGLIGILLLSQLLTVAYACPSLRFLSATNATVTEIGDAQQNLRAVTSDSALVAGNFDDSTNWTSTPVCGEHCKLGQQSAQTQVIHVPVALLAMLYEVPAVPDAPSPRRQANADLSSLVASEPPHAVLHCVRRT